MAPAVLQREKPRFLCRNADGRCTEPLVGCDAALIPADRRRKAKIFCRHNSFSFSAHVARGRPRPVCSDTVVMFAHDDFFMAAVMDGYCAGGHHYSFEMGRMLLDSARRMALGRLSRLDAAYLLMSSANAIPHPLPDGGTTATVMLVNKDGKYDIAGIGDSAAYRLSPGFAKRLFDCSTIIDPDSSPGLRTRLRIGIDTVDVDDYLGVRDILFGAVRQSVDTWYMETATGVLGPGARLMLVSDGITKNLAIVTSLGMDVLDASGNSDVAEILRGQSEVALAASHLLSKARRRSAAGRTEKRSGERLHIVAPSDDDMAVAMISLDSGQPRTG